MHTDWMEAIVLQLRGRLVAALLAGEAELADQMMAVRLALKEWDGAGPLPHADALRGWGITLPPPPTAPEPPAWDPDDDLGEAFDTAQAYLNARRYRAALDAFDGLMRRATGRLHEPSMAGYAMATSRLADQLRPHLERAQRHADKQPDDFRGQRQLWERVLEIDPRAETAIRALRGLDRREMCYEIDRAIADIRIRLDWAVERNWYPTIVELLGEAEALAGGQQLPERRHELDELVVAVRVGRGKVRDSLGLASTMAGMENYRGTYLQAREYIDRNVPVVFDERGVFGPVGSTYDPVDFLRLARMSFIDWLRRKVYERMREAAHEATIVPERALQTLLEAHEFLTDEVLTSDDKAILDETMRDVNREIGKLQQQLEKSQVAGGMTAATPPATEGKK